MNSYERAEKKREAGELREYLETGPVSGLVDQRLQGIYNQLPDRLNVKKETQKPKKNRLLRGVFGSVGAAAAMLVLLVGINAANPAFAEELPLLGGLFKRINASTFYAETTDSERIEKNAASIPEAEAENAMVENELYKITAEKIYYDGRFLHSILELQTALKPGSEDFELGGSVRLNGKAANVLEDEYAGNILPHIEWMSIGRDSYMAEIKFAVPQEFRSAQSLEVEYEFMLSDAKSYREEMDRQAALIENAGEEKESILNKKPLRLDEGMDNRLKFTAASNTDDAVSFDVNLENSGAELYSFYTSPAGTEIYIDVPMEGDKGTYAELFTLDGKEIGGIYYKNAAFTGKAETEHMEKYFYFDGVKEEYDQVILRLSAAQGHDDDNTEYRLIEYLIDLKQQTAAPSELHSEKNSPLYYNEELQWITPQINPTYRASNQELLETDGYKLEYLSSSGVHKSVYMTLVTPNEYRELRVELYVNGELRHTETTQPDGETNCFMPLPDYEYDPMYIAYNEDGSMWIHDSGYFPRDEAVKSGLNIQQLRMGQRFFQMDDSVEIKVYDCETGSLLHEESQTMTLPEGIEIGEGQRLYKAASVFYYVIAEDAGDRKLKMEN